jgi:hypothetical protein
MQEKMATKTGSRDRESHQKYAQRLPSCPAALEFLHGGFDTISTSTHKLTRMIHGDAVWMRANDPSAGSPTETLLRLLLPLSVKVH